MKTIMRASVVSLNAVLLVSGLQAADRIWDGGGSSTLWSAAANWDGDAAAPSQNDALYFGGSSKVTNTNDLTADWSFAGLTFNSGAGAFTLLGNRLTLGGNVTNASSNTQTINLPVILSGTRDFNASNGAITVNGALSGAGGLTKYGPQTLMLTASNSYDGLTTISTGTVVITHANALGSLVSGTTVNTSQGATLDVRGGLTIAEPLTFTGGNNNRNCFVNTTGTNTLSALMTSAGGRYYINGGTALILAGGVTNNPMLVINGSGTLFVRTTPLTMGTGNFYADDTSLTIIDVASNAWGELTIAKGIVRMNVKNALPPAATIRMGLSYGPLGTLDLNGFDQTTTRLYNGTATGAGTACIVTSGPPATLTINQSTSSSTFEGQWAGAAGLCKTGTGTLLLTNAANSTFGNFTVSNGTLVVTTASSLGNSTNILVAGGTLELQNGTALSDAAAVTVLDGGAKLKIATNLTETVDRLFLGGTQQVRGTYGASSDANIFDSAHFSGGGLLRVLTNPPLIPTNYVWDAGGADTYLSTAANWTNDVLPEFTGTSWLYFGSGGGTATVNTNANLYGMTLNRDANFTVANGNGTLTLGLGGLTAYAPTSTGRAYTIAEDVTLGTNQTWNVTNLVGGTTLTVSGVIGAGANVQGLTKIGDGTLVLSGSNTFDAVITNWCGGIQVSSSNALGSTAGATVINTLGANSAWLSFYGGITLAEPLTFIGGSVNGGCLNNNGGTNTVSGPIITSGGRYVTNPGTLLNIIGGVTGPNPFFVVNSHGTMVFTKTPLNLGTGTFHADSEGLTILGVSSNVWGDTLFTGGTLRMDVANVFPTNTTLRMGGVWYGPNCTLDLNGCNQTIAGLIRAEFTPGTIAITSAVPVTLTVNQSATTGWDGKFTGYVSLLKLGSGSLTITNAPTSTAGSFIVSNGTLVVGSAGTLGNNSTNIVVGGTGTLTLQNSATLADSATVRIADGGAKVSLASGVNEAVRYLFLGGVQKRVGTYGSTSSTAAVKDDAHFSGTGILTVLHDKSGTLIGVK